MNGKKRERIYKQMMNDDLESYIIWSWNKLIINIRRRRKIDVSDTLLLQS